MSLNVRIQPPSSSFASHCTNPTKGEACPDAHFPLRVSHTCMDIAQISCCTALQTKLLVPHSSKNWSANFRDVDSIEAILSPEKSECTYDYFLRVKTKY